MDRMGPEKRKILRQLPIKILILLGAFVSAQKIRDAKLKQVEALCEAAKVRLGPLMRSSRDENFQRLYGEINGLRESIPAQISGNLTATTSSAVLENSETHSCLLPRRFIIGRASLKIRSATRYQSLVAPEGHCYRDPNSLDGCLSVNASCFL
ncbi:hypothetical protein B0T26DRAFT_141602 [Lasiosphaeria miniovina]|uniref:Uncharacterized protein n=1 Tax=Lasiosphaeria miniovina TaxID=1954250 RepID=A0AA40B4U0_9PEZI|nr:uncharacterized protein B0T26DRAFT_141602 [Lasiosphaeria miniovina]KAK0727629.1 hypothetical protein B0T26DRAFT_141602 [Lasiosphaeria miniovina]